MTTADGLFLFRVALFHELRVSVFDAEIANVSRKTAENRAIFANVSRGPTKIQSLFATNAFGDVIDDNAGGSLPERDCTAQNSRKTRGKIAKKSRKNRGRDAKALKIREKFLLCNGAGIERGVRAGIGVSGPADVSCHGKANWHTGEKLRISL